MKNFVNICFWFASYGLSLILSFSLPFYISLNKKFLYGHENQLRALKKIPNYTHILCTTAHKEEILSYFFLLSFA